MNQKRLMENYRRLCGVSSSGADIFGSELCAELLKNRPGAALKMQLEQERFFRLLESGDPLESLGPYTGTERRGVLLHLLEEADGLCGIVWTEQKRLRTVRLPLPELESLTAAAVERAAQRVCTETAFPENTASWSPAALAAALSAELPEETPEKIAAVSAALSVKDQKLPLLRTLLVLSPLQSNTQLLRLFLDMVSCLTGGPVSDVFSTEQETESEEEETEWETEIFEDGPETSRERA